MEKFSVQSFIGRFCKPDIEEFSVESDEKLELGIMIDVDRTRSGLLSEGERRYLGRLLGYYCKTNGHSYKQGMNEIMAPFMLLNRYGVKDYVIVTCFSNFIQKFASTLFIDDFLKPLEGLFEITKLILLYHYPEIYKVFEVNLITPDVYMTSWFVTIFANRIKEIGLVYMFWQTLCDKGDVIFLSYFGIAMLGYYRSLILSYDYTTLPRVFRDVVIKNYDDFFHILSMAISLREKMPFTTEWVLKKYEVFQLEKIDLVLSSLKNRLGVGIMPRGIMTALYSHDLTCYCEGRKDCGIAVLNHLIIDCREASETKRGYLKNSILLEKSYFKKKSKLEEYCNKFANAKHVYHISLLGSLGTAQDEVLSILFKSFTKANFPYISVVEGGYPACHDFALKHKLEVLNHKAKNCQICIKKAKLEKRTISSSCLETRSSLITEKIFACKLTEIEDIDSSNLGLAIMPRNLLVLNRESNEILESFPIDQISKITSNKSLPELISLSFKHLSFRKEWFLDTPDVKEFLFKLKKNYLSIEKSKAKIKGKL